jgi:hypothetical protein
VNRRIWAPLVVAAVALAAPATASAGRYVRISDERETTFSAFVNFTTPVRAAPSLRSRTLATLRPMTYHGRPEVVLVLGWRESKGRTWYRIRFPGLGYRVGWVRPDVLSEDETQHRTLVVVDRSVPELRFLRDGKVRMRVPIGVGAASSPTPPGHYYIRERLALSNSSSIYGALAFGTSAFSRYRTDWPGGGQVGIHGTNEPSLIPGWISNGCVRLRNPDILALGKRIEPGTPVLIK